MNGIDMNIIRGKKSRIITSEDALKNVQPIEWGKNVLDGQEKVTVTAAQRRKTEWDAK